MSGNFKTDAVFCLVQPIPTFVPIEFRVVAICYYKLVNTGRASPHGLRDTVDVFESEFSEGHIVCLWLDPKNSLVGGLTPPRIKR